MDKRHVALKEYEIVRATIEDRASRILTVKGWGLTLAAAGLAAAAQVQSPLILYIVSGASAAFWFLEAGLHGRQRLYSQRSMQIEMFLSSGGEDSAFKTPWISHHRSESSQAWNGFISALKPQVFLPNGLVAVLCALATLNPSVLNLPLGRH